MIGFFPQKKNRLRTKIKKKTINGEIHPRVLTKLIYFLTITLKKKNIQENEEKPNYIMNWIKMKKLNH